MAGDEVAKEDPKPKQATKTLRIKQRKTFIVNATFCLRGEQLSRACSEGTVSGFSSAFSTEKEGEPPRSCSFFGSLLEVEAPNET